MPDHLHFLAQGLDGRADLLRLLKSFKIKSSRTYERECGQILWQRRFFDHILRPTESIEDFAWYIWLNPVRGGMVKTPQNIHLRGR
jgi:putative transposase